MRKSLIIILLLLPFCFLRAQEISGVYETDFNEMTLKINGNYVTGDYKYANGRIEGTLDGLTLTGWWYQGDSKGRLIFEFESDFSSFKGKWSFGDGVPSSKWNGKKIKSNQSNETSQFWVAGTYETDFNEMTLKQNGNYVYGTYKYADGRIEGTLVNRVLTGYWYQNNSKGKLVFEFNYDATSFKGKWSYGEAVPNSKWDGKKTE